MQVAKYLARDKTMKLWKKLSTNLDLAILIFAVIAMIVLQSKMVEKYRCAATEV